MKKALLILVTLLCTTMFSLTASAKGIDKNLGESVYASDQKAIAESMNKIEKIQIKLEAFKLTVVTDSIMPIFEADLIDYAKTGEFEISPVLRLNVQKYFAKTLTPDGKFAGNIEFTIDGDDADICIYLASSYVKAENEGVISLSFPDHKRRIEKLVGKKVSPEEIRFVSVNALGQVFYYNNGEKEAFIAVEGGNGDIFNNDNGGIVYLDKYLYEKAQVELKKDEEEKSKVAGLENINDFPVGGDGDYNTFAINPADVDNIIDTPDNVNAQKGNKNIITTNENQLWIYVTISSIAVLIIAAGVFLFFRRRKKKTRCI